MLIDAPCSASGLIQKKPEILIKNKEINIIELAKKQDLMLSKSKYLVKNGGYIIYCVCSIHSKETTETIEKFLSGDIHLLDYLMYLFQLNQHDPIQSYQV